jgi:beta-alanine degradation protein BauB
MATAPKRSSGLENPNFRKAGVEHDVLNETGAEIVFLEVELKP